MGDEVKCWWVINEYPLEDFSKPSGPFYSIEKAVVYIESEVETGTYIIMEEVKRYKISYDRTLKEI